MEYAPQITTFAELISGIATLLRIAQPTPAAASLQLIVDDMPVTLMDNDAVQPDSVVFACDFGPLPPGTQRATALEELLQANLYTVGAGAPVFCLNADTGHVLFVGKAAIAQTSVNRVLKALTAFAHEARVWRSNCENPAPNTTEFGMPARRYNLLQAAYAANNISE